MVDMLMGDENVYGPISLQLIRQNLKAAVKLLPLPPPVVKNKQQILCFQRKTAVIIMCDPELTIHRIIAPPKGKTFPAGKRMGKTRPEKEKTHHLFQSHPEQEAAKSLRWRKF